jgi:murein DD-endopeptidase MepM/ murein hydrolase activator NlpD
MIIGTPVTDIIEVRNDNWGEGSFGSRRGSKFHDGLDIVVELGDSIYSMIDGVIEKVDYPYASDLNWTGIQISNHYVRTEIWYMSPRIDKNNLFVKEGDLIGTAQDISQKYPPVGDNEGLGLMTPHIHVRVTLKAFTVIANGRYVSYEIHVDPLLFIGE